MSSDASTLEQSADFDTIDQKIILHGLGNRVGKYVSH